MNRYLPIVALITLLLVSLVSPRATFSAIVSIEDSKSEMTLGSISAPITIIEFASLSCHHCAKFHKETLPRIKKDYIDKNLVKFEHHSFPLDLAALNAEIIVRCHVDNKKKFQLLMKIQPQK